MYRYEEMKLYHVYKLFDRREPTKTMYVGISSQKSVSIRLSQHLNNMCKNFYLWRWIEDLRENGLLPEIEELETFYATKKQVLLKEQAYIYSYLEQGMPLLNMQHTNRDRSFLFNLYYAVIKSKVLTC